MQGTFVVTGTATKPALDVDQVYNNSLTVVAKTTAGVTVHLKADDYEQTLVADSRGIGPGFTPGRIPMDRVRASR